MSHQLTVCITFDFDAISAWIGSFGTDSPSTLSRGEFGAVAVPRLIDLLRRHGIPSTWFVPGHTAYAYPDLVRQIRDEGHEIGHHGWVHQSPATLDAAQERHSLERGLEALAHVASVRPTGYRAPEWAFSAATIELLEQAGFEWDSSCMANDFYPYYLRRGDRWSHDGPYIFGDLVNIVEIPVSWDLDDFPLFEPVAGVNPGLASANHVEQIWRGDLEYAVAHCRGGVLTLTLHPQVIGRGHRLMMLERLLSDLRGWDAVVFKTIGEYAADWRSRNGLSQWAQENPVLAMAGPRGAPASLLEIPEG